MAFQLPRPGAILDLHWAQPFIDAIEQKFSTLAAPASAALPDQSGQSGKWLRTVGGAAVWQAIDESGLTTSDVTTGDVSATKHGYAPKTPADTNKFLRGDGTWANVAPLPPGTGVSTLLFDSIVSGADAASIDTGAGGIDGSYDELEIWLYLRTDEVAALSAVALTFNNDTGNNYDRILIQVLNVSVTGSNSRAQPQFALNAAGASLAANVFAAYRISFPSYAETGGFKAGELTGGIAEATAANCLLQNQSYSYRSTAAISRAAVTPMTAGKKLKISSRMLIYGR